MSTKDYSSKQEKSVADYLVWDVVSGSGARDFNKGDVIAEDWLGECKTHEQKSDIIFKKAVWDKICREAEDCRRNPVLIVDDGYQDIAKTWCIFKKSSIPDIDLVEIEELPGYYQTNIIFDHKWLNDEFEKDKKYYNFSLLVYQTDVFGETVVVCPLCEFSDIISYY